MFSIAGLFIMFAAVLGSGSMVAVLGWMFFRIKALEAGQGNSGELGQLLEQIDEIHENLDLTRQEVAELTERLDFTERLLAKGDSRDEGQAKS